MFSQYRCWNRSDEPVGSLIIVAGCPGGQQIGLLMVLDIISLGSFA